MQLISDIGILRDELPPLVRKKLAVAEFVFFRKMLACGIADMLEYSVVERCRWKLDERWGVPARLVEKTPLLATTV